MRVEDRTRLEKAVRASQPIYGDEQIFEVVNIILQESKLREAAQLITVLKVGMGLAGTSSPQDIQEFMSGALAGAEAAMKHYQDVTRIS